MGGASLKILAQLRSLGYEDARIEHHGGNYPEVVVFAYRVHGGRFHDRAFRVGISMGNVNEGFPEYPPHYLHTSPPVESPQDGSTHSTYAQTDPDGVARRWTAFSRPPGPFWDRLPTKTIEAFLEHVRRFWSQV